MRLVPLIGGHDVRALAGAYSRQPAPPHGVAHGPSLALQSVSPVALVPDLARLIRGSLGFAVFREVREW